MAYPAGFKKYFLVFFSVILVFFCMGSYANGYVLHGSHLLELMSKKMGKSKGLLVSQKLIIYDSANGEKSLEFAETLSYLFPENFRSDIVAENTRRYHILSNNLSITLIDGQITSEIETDLDYYKDIILYNSRELLEKRLADLGVDCSVSSLGRLDGKVVYIIGSEYPGITVSQLWIDKETFMPVRWMLVPCEIDSREELLDIRYLSWKKIGHVWYPVEIKFYQNNLLFRKIIVEKIEPDPIFSKNRFNINSIKTAYNLNVPDLPEKSSGLDEVQKAIEKFKKIYE
ncbi:MAG TPA: hypothetical protein DD405_02455 [Desulfobacteraceae bacterium]|nr:hypothetical protein [Desulfobacteraceae bacterium]